MNPLQNSIYYVNITSSSGCIYSDSVFVQVDSSVPNINIQDSINLCLGDSLLINPLNIDNAIWTPVLNSYDTVGINIWIKSDSNITYYITSNNACGQSTDSISVNIVEFTGNAFGDTVICFGDTAEIYATEGLYYFWYPNNNLSHYDSSWTYAFPIQNTDFKVIIENLFGCKDTLEIFIEVSPIPIANAGFDFWMQYGDPINLNGITNTNNFYWESSSWLSCSFCLNPQINPSEKTEYIFYVSDSIGCRNSDTVEVNIKGSIFVPNTFTPNNDGLNDVFEIVGDNIKSFELWIYNKWGEEIYYSSEILNYWDGKYKGKKCKIDSYIWVIEYLDFNQNFNTLKGHINIIE